MRRMVVLLFCGWTLFAAAQTADSPWLYGIHWYGDPALTDVEAMSGGKGVWDLEITHVDASKAPAWDQPGYYASTVCPPVASRGHSFIFRMQPYWDRNVPHSSDPYTLTQFAADAKSAADTLKNHVHIWQIGNEVNIRGENKRWGGSDYDTLWEPTPAQYADTYVALRDKIREITPNTNPATQIVLMQPVSPGNTDTWRYMDGNEFLWRQIEAVADKNKIDGFAVHGYAEPGAADYGIRGFWDSIREQLMIIDQFGLGDRPVYITEWNKHMPNAAEAQIGAKFLHRAYTALRDWNAGSGGAWPGLPNHNIVAACWFVYPDSSWTDYSLKYWKSQIVSTDKELNPWYSFQHAASLNYAKGISGGGATVPQNAFWWRDDFSGATLDQTPPLPDWKAETTASGSVVMSGDGAVRFLGNSSNNGGGGLRTAGYVYGNFRLETEIVFTNVARAGTATPEANFDLRVREGSKGYSLTFFTSASPNNTNRIILRRTNEWTQIGSHNVLVPGGINSGDTFRVSIVADGSTLVYQVYKNAEATPVVNWSASDSGQKVGWIRLMTYNMQEARLTDFRLGGPQWVGGAPTGVEGWQFF